MVINSNIELLIIELKCLTYNIFRRIAGINTFTTFKTHVRVTEITSLSFIISAEEIVNNFISGMSSICALASSITHI